MFYRVFIFVALMASCGITSYAQAPYTGGKGSGFSMAASESVHIDANGKIGPAISKNVIFPNPVLSGNYIKISFREPVNSGFDLEIINSLGQVCLQERIISAGSDFQVRLPQLAQGIYLVRTVTEGQRQIHKLLIYSSK